jgi:adenylosuccinate synthase
LPDSFTQLVELIEKNTQVKVSYVSNGVGREQLINM